MQLAMHMVTIEDLMPQGHFLRKLEAALDLSFVYEETAPLYSKKYGRPAHCSWQVYCITKMNKEGAFKRKHAIFVPTGTYVVCI